MSQPDACIFCTCEREVGGATFVGGLFRELHADGLEPVFATAFHFQAEVVVLVHGADLLGAFFLGQAWRHGIAHLVIVGCGIRVLEPVERAHTSRAPL
jgi:hypothetical protein